MTHDATPDHDPTGDSADVSHRRLTAAEAARVKTWLSIQDLSDYDNATVLAEGCAAELEIWGTPDSVAIPEEIFDLALERWEAERGDPSC